VKKLDPQVERELRRGVIDVIPEQQFFDGLASGRSLRLKLGLDPSKPDLHIGHGVLLRKLRLLQEMGHQVVLIVGDWTAQIGDPSGQSIMRPMLTAEEVRANAETYMRQFFYVVDKKKTEVRWQSEWFDKFTLTDTVRLASRFTVAQMLQREDFRTRYEAKKPLGVHELFYPLLQAYDSVVIEADVEFGGTDQLFNLLVGRELQEQMGQRPQVCITMRLLAGTDGSQKMSKSLGNTIDFEDPPSEKYGKVMSVPDSALMDYLELATDIAEEELAYVRKQLEERAVNPMEIKKRLAREIVAQFHGEAAAGEAEEAWGRVFSKGQAPAEAEMTTFAFSFSKDYRADGTDKYRLTEIFVAAGLVASVAEARRLIQQGAVEQMGDGANVRISQPIWVVKHGDRFRVGKHRFLRIVDSDSK
jgi:tyrosyl-tRNA synthetase